MVIQKRLGPHLIKQAISLNEIGSQNEKGSRLFCTISFFVLKYFKWDEDKHYVGVMS